MTIVEKRKKKDRDEWDEKREIIKEEGGEANYISSSEVHPRWVYTKSSKTKRHAQTNQISSTSSRLLFTFYFFYYFVALTSLSYLSMRTTPTYM